LSSGARELLAAVDVLREMNRTNARKVSADAPVGFIRPRWKRFVFADGDVSIAGTTSSR
jgi:hypothetical protein